MRRNYDERPKFGTVSDALFSQGEDGLLAGDNEDEDGNQKRQVPEWEQALDQLGSKKLGVK